MRDLEWHCADCGHREPANDVDSREGDWDECPLCAGVARVRVTPPPRPTRGPLAPWLVRAAVTLMALLMVACGSGGERPRLPMVPFGAVPEAALAPLLDRTHHRCNASAIGAGVLVTAAHCYPEDARRQYVDGATWARALVWAPHGAKLQRADRELDFAVLAAEGAFRDWLGVRTMKRGELVAAIVWRDAEWVALPDTSGEPGHFDRVVPIRKGDSGSPVVGVDGSLLGVVITCTVKSNDRDNCIGGGRWRPVGDLL